MLDPRYVPGISESAPWSARIDQSGRLALNTNQGLFRESAAGSRKFTQIAPEVIASAQVLTSVEDESGQPVSHMDDEWHTYTIEWINDHGLENGPNGRCLFYIDGVLQYTIHDMSPDSMSEVLIGYRDLAWAGPDNPIGWTGEHTMELDWYRVTPIDYESPNANFDSYALQGGLNTVVDSVLDNDKGFGLTAVLLNQPDHGVLVLNADGTFTYTPDAEFSGRDHFVYYATDNTKKGASNACVVELIVNNSPVVDTGLDHTIVLSGSAPWSPVSVSPVVWFDASDASTITSSGSNVTHWADKSGNANHATASVANKCPQSGLSTIDGKNVIQGVDRDEYMEISPATSPVKACFAVVSVNSGSANELMALGGQGTNPSLFVRSSGDQASFDGSGSSQGSYSVNAAGYSGYAENHASIGISPGQAFLFSGVWQNNSPLNRIIGYDGASNGPTSDERIAEVIWLAAEPSGEEREKIEGYLAHKWGLATNLPEGHAYVAQAPGGSGAVANLDGTATDPDGNPTTTWTHVGGTGGGVVTFGNVSAVDTTATFSQTGTYVLRLTADDGYVQTYDEVTITVVAPQTFTEWVSAYSLGGLSGLGDDPDGDRLTNSIENYFGTDPGVSSQGIEAVAFSPGANATFTFTHPLNVNPASDLTASYIWSKDLITFHADGAADGSTTVTFAQGQPSHGQVAVTATILGPASKVFVAVQVSQD